MMTFVVWVVYLRQNQVGVIDGNVCECSLVGNSETSATFRSRRRAASVAADRIQSQSAYTSDSDASIGRLKRSRDKIVAIVLVYDAPPLLYFHVHLRDAFINIYVWRDLSTTCTRSACCRTSRAENAAVSHCPQMNTATRPRHRSRRRRRRRRCPRDSGGSTLPSTTWWPNIPASWCAPSARTFCAAPCHHTVGLTSRYPTSSKSSYCPRCRTERP